MVVAILMDAIGLISGSCVAIKFVDFCVTSILLVGLARVKTTGLARLFLLLLLFFNSCLYRCPFIVDGIAQPFIDLHVNFRRMIEFGYWTVPYLCHHQLAQSALKIAIYALSGGVIFSFGTYFLKDA